MTSLPVPEIRLHIKVLPPLTFAVGFSFFWNTSAASLSLEFVHPHPAGVHLHVPLGPDHIVLVGGHWDSSPGTESRVTGSEGSVGAKQQCHKHGWMNAARGGVAHFSSPVSCFSRSLRGVCPPELQTEETQLQLKPSGTTKHQSYTLPSTRTHWFSIAPRCQWPVARAHSSADKDKRNSS